MKLSIPRGKYLLAVSGGVDSMALLDMLAKKPGINLIVAHFNHGIRQDSGQDAALVKQAAAAYGLIFELGSARLGKGASEAAARDARYGFLKRAQAKYGAKAIITAHHQDDLIETALINLIRGTGRLGLSAIRSNKHILRPLLDTPKVEIENYARKHKLKWLKDSTNQDTEYLRNHLRLDVLPNLTTGQRQILISNIDKVAKTNIKIDHEIATLSRYSDDDRIDRISFSALPSEVGNELIAFLLRRAGVTDYDSKTINRLSMAIKTSKPNSSHPVKQNSSLEVTTRKAHLVTP
jgi:tRNA(Ile)-lysidine synthetase-like protein